MAPAGSDIGGVSEVAELLGVTRQRVASLRARPGFPDPVVELSAGPIFDLDQVRRWAASARRASGRPRTTADRVLGGRYLIEGSPIGWGGFGEVYKATDRQASQRDRMIVAAKVLHPRAGMDAVDFDRFRREQRILSQHHHPNVIRALDHGEEADGTLWYVMALAKGSLSDRIPDIAGDIPAVVDIIKQVGAGIGHLHEHGIIHRDVKPGNVLQLRTAVWAVSDLGLARRLGAHDSTSLTTTGVGVGSLWFTPPEQWTDAKSVSEAADIFGLGRVLHVLLTGSEGAITDIAHDGLRAVVRKATNSAPSRRYSSIDKFLRALLDAVISPGGIWRTRSEELDDLQQELGERLHSVRPDPTAIAETRALIAESEENAELLDLLDAVVPYMPEPAIGSMWEDDPDGLRDFLSRLAEHMRHRSYDFSFTDHIAAFYRKCVNVSLDDPEVMRWSVVALVRVGTYHNRWRVRDTVASILQSARTPEQALAVAEAIRDSDGGDVEWSVSEIGLPTLHPAVVRAIEQVTSTG